MVQEVDQILAAEVCPKAFELSSRSVHVHALAERSLNSSSTTFSISVEGASLLPAYLSGDLFDCSTLVFHLKNLQPHASLPVRLSCFLPTGDQALVLPQSLPFNPPTLSHPPTSSLSTPVAVFSLLTFQSTDDVFSKSASKAAQSHSPPV